MKKRSILVVHPDHGICTFLTFLLSQEGYSITCVPSPKKGSKLLLESHFDLVLTDAFDQATLFDLDDSFLHELRQNNPLVPIVLCTTHCSSERLRAGDYGLAEIISLPEQVENISSIITNVIQKCLPATATEE